MEYFDYQSDASSSSGADDSGAEASAAESAAEEGGKTPALTKKAAKKVSKKKTTTKKKATKKASKKSTKKAASSKKASKKTSKKKSSKKKTAGRKKKAGKRSPAHGKNLVIVESPAKAKTINRYLGNKFLVQASVGHVRDLPRSRLGVDVEKDFSPHYITIRGKKDVINELKRNAQAASHVYLATDPDREGEAIAWHLFEALGLVPEKAGRVTFNEITKAAIEKAFEQPRDIEMELVNAQQARRILDRLVGYSISPILWKKITKGLSAGRVQSVAQRLICEREEEIEKFKPEEYWSIWSYLMKQEVADALSPRDREALKVKLVALDAPSQKEEEEEDDKPAKKKVHLPEYLFKAELKKWQGATPKVTSKQEADTILQALEGVDFNVQKIETKERKDRPKPPFITSTLQQTASNKIGFTARRTMRVAQSLYEGIDLGKEGATGLITYMRTDSVHLSDFAMDEARELINKSFGDKYLPEKRVLYKSSGRAQAAHEAIRPTSALRTPSSIKSYLSPEQYKLYNLIWERFIACQMKPAVYLVTNVDIEAGQGLFRVSGKRLQFDGHTRLSGLKLEKGDQLLPELQEGEKLHCEKLKGDQHFTQPPPRYTEASLVRTLEKLGIGRPSTYAAIISTIVDRGYVMLDKRRFYATELGKIVTDLLIGNFSRIVDSEFTAKMENQLDKVEEGKLDWIEVMKNFYELFKDELAEAEKKIESIKGTPALDNQGKAVDCPLCTTPMVVRWSRNGKFFGCSDYPECKGTLPIGEDGNPIALKKEDIECPSCGSSMVVRIGKRGPFLGCSEFPKCRGTKALEASKSPEQRAAEERFAGLLCDKCKSPMGVRIGRGKPFLGCTAYPECKNALSLKKVEKRLEDGEMKLDPQLREETLERYAQERAEQESLRNTKSSS